MEASGLTPTIIVSEGSRDSTQESATLNKNLKKSGLLITGDRGQVLV
jgi:hypothetical protein